MKYKALMLDVDGTLIPYDYWALPSDKVAAAVKSAQEKGITVGLVTGRGYTSLKDVLEKLTIHTGYAVVDGGAHVVDLETEEAVHSQPIRKEDAQKVMEICERENIIFHIKDKVRGLAYLDEQTKVQPFETIYMFFTNDIYTSEQLDPIIKELTDYSSYLTVHKSSHKYQGKFGLNITHVSATKAHGLEIVMQKTGLKKEEIIAAGDGYNDFPLLMASGLKVAMGNAVDDLKAIADYIAPSVNEDGIVDVIEKFILS